MNPLKKLKIYLDNCCFNRPYDDQTQLRIELETKAKLFIQDLIVKSKVSLVWSYVLEYELSKNPFMQKKYVITLFSKNMSENVDVDKSIEVFNIAKTIIQSGIKQIDALHIACAIIAKCDYFITTDDRVLKYKTNELKITDPIAFIKEV